MWFSQSANLLTVPTQQCLGFAAEWFGFMLTGFLLGKSGPEALLQLCNTDASSFARIQTKDGTALNHTPLVWGTRLKSNLKSYPLRPATCAVHSKSFHLLICSVWCQITCWCRNGLSKKRRMVGSQGTGFCFSDKKKETGG